MPPSTPGTRRAAAACVALARGTGRQDEVSKGELTMSLAAVT